MNKRDEIEGRPFHPLGMNRKNHSSQIQDIPFMNNKYDFKTKKKFSMFLQGGFQHKKNSLNKIELK